MAHENQNNGFGCSTLVLLLIGIALLRYMGCAP